MLRALFRQLTVVGIVVLLALLSGFAVAAIGLELPAQSYHTLAFSQSTPEHLLRMGESYAKWVNRILTQLMSGQTALEPLAPQQHDSPPAADIILGRPLDHVRSIGPSATAPVIDGPGDGRESESRGDGESDSWAPTVHTVSAGETLSQLARRFGLEPATIIDVNALRNPDLLRIGQQIIIPPVDGRMYEVRQGDVLWAVSEQFNVDAGDIIDANDIDDPAVLYAGQVLFIPGAGGQAVPGAVAAFHSSSGEPELSWPLPMSGRISSPFGLRSGIPHTGVDLAVPAGTPIRAAADGRVLTARWLGAYGRTVVLVHGDSRWKTLYAHASRMVVQEGQFVRAGDTISFVGSTGRSTGPHLHFEVIVNGRPRDPLQFVSRNP